jgi:hypothetical protein
MLFHHGGVAPWSLFFLENAFSFFNELCLQMIAGYYRQTLNKPKKRDWNGRNGTITKIFDIFKFLEGSNERVKRVL